MGNPEYFSELSKIDTNPKRKRKGIIEFRGKAADKQLAFTYPFTSVFSLLKCLYASYKNRNHTMFIIHWDK